MRIFLTIVFLLLVFVAGFFFFIAFSFGGLPHYVAMTILATLAIAASAVVYLVKGIKLRTLAKSIGFIAAVCALVTAGFELYAAYVRTIPVIHEQEVDLSAYTPFGDTSITAKLASPASLKLEDDLPIMDGATALYPVYAAFAEAVYPPGEYPRDSGSVRCTQTIASYQALADSLADVIFVAGPSAEQVAYAASKGVTFKLHPIGKEAFVFFVHQKNQVDNLSLEQLKGIYSGNISRWRTVGGRWSRIIAYQRPEGSGSQTALIRMMGDTRITEPPTDRVPSGMGGMVYRVAAHRNYSNALGFTFRYYATDMVQHEQVRLLKVDGVFPDSAAIQEGNYPLTEQFYAATRQEPSANTQKLIAWILSEQGQELIGKSGYVPIR